MEPTNWRKRICVSIPADLGKRMMKEGRNFNWSKIAQEAFEEVLREAPKRKRAEQLAKEAFYRVFKEEMAARVELAVEVRSDGARSGAKW